MHIEYHFIRYNGFLCRIPQDIVLFNDEEFSIISNTLEILSELKKFTDIDSITKTRHALEELAHSISLYPSILEKHRLGKSMRSIDSLIDRLCHRRIQDLILHIPTKAIIGRGYSIAKINFLFMLFYLSRDVKELAEFEGPLLTQISNNVFVITSEEVFTSIVEDKSIKLGVRSRAVYHLAHVWEYRIGYGIEKFTPILQNLWKARKKLTPQFGTLTGFSELFLISEDVDQSWFDFLERDDLQDEEIYALEEFIFGLTYEEIEKLRSEMELRNKNSLSKDDAMRILGFNQSFPEYAENDPRELYRSFRDRKQHSRFRVRARINGPGKTLEEYLMCYLLEYSDPGIG